jgi:hypothetical protein
MRGLRELGDKPATGMAGLSASELLQLENARAKNVRTRCTHCELLVDPNDAGFFHLRVLLFEVAGKGAERNSLCLREIRSWPFALGGGVTRGGKDAVFRGHGRITCVSVMTLKAGNRHLTV